MQPSKERAVELAAKLRDAAKLHDPLAKTIVELVALTIEDLKDNLVAASGDDLLRLQGAARHFQKLYRELTIVPPSIAKAKE
jgi:N-acetylglucosamine kinase-like BadF-type ATPase